MNQEIPRNYKIAVNTRLLLKNNLEGIGWFSYNILKILAEKYPQHTFYFIFDRPFDDSFIFGKNVIPIVISPPARHPILWYIWYEWSIPKVLRKIKADVFLSMDSYTSISAICPKITVIHDIAFVFFEHQMPRWTQWYMRHFTPKFIETSSKIITVSQSTKLDLVSFYDAAESNIIVANNAPSSLFQPLSNEEIIEFKRLNTDNCDYFVYIGSIHPRKNIINLLKAFEVYKTQRNDTTKLAIVGRVAWQSKDVMDYYETMEIKKEVLFISHSSQSEISQWLAASLCLIFVPLYEGFGIPLVEAMACHTPIICSNSSSMPEVVGDAALLVDCLSPFDIAEAMVEMATSPELRLKLIENGNKRKEIYTWEKAADIVWKTIEEAITTNLSPLAKT